MHLGLTWFLFYCLEQGRTLFLSCREVRGILYTLHHVKQHRTSLYCKIRYRTQINYTACLTLQSVLGAMGDNECRGNLRFGLLVCEKTFEATFSTTATLATWLSGWLWLLFLFVVLLRPNKDNNPRNTHWVTRNTNVKPQCPISCNSVLAIRKSSNQTLPCWPVEYRLDSAVRN